MKREQEFAKNTLVLAIGKYFPKLFALVTLPIITGQLTKAEYGTYDLINTLVSLLLPIVTLQIQSAAFRFLIDCRDKKKDSSIIISNIFFFTVFTSVITVVIFFFVYSSADVLIKLLICAYFLIDILQIAIGMCARGLGYNSVYSKNAVIISAVNCILVFLLVYLGRKGLAGVLISLIVANLAAYIYMAIKIKFFGYIRITFISKKVLKELIAYSWPLIPNNLSNWVLSVSDRLVITGFLGIEANAVYAVANKIPSLLNEAQSVVVMGWQENASITAKDEDSDTYYSSMFQSMYDIVFALIAILIAAMPVVFAILIQGDYDEAYTQMPILIIGNFFFCMSAFLGGIYVAYKKTLSVAITTVLAAAVNLIIDFLLVQKIGITAGSISTLTAYLALFLFRMFDVRRLKRMSYHYVRMIIQVCILILMGVLAVQRSTILSCINIGLAILFSCLFNQKLFKGLVKKAYNVIKSKTKSK